MAAELTFVATCDLAAIVRGRAVPGPLDARLIAGGTGWVPADLALTSLGAIAADNMFGAAGDLRLLPDTTTAIDLPAAPDLPASRIVLADQVDLAGKPWAGCPRRFLKDSLGELESAHGLRLSVAFEHEFMLSGLAATPPFSWERLRRAEPFGTELVALLSAIGYEPENWLPEYGDGQFEVTVAPRPALLAADRAILLRELVRDLAVQHGRRATFVPVADPQGTGNGVHIHLSLQDLDGGSAMYDADGPGRLSEVSRRFAAGIIEHSAAVCAVTAPSRPSYLRLAPHRWSAGGAFLADRNREALLRICPTPTLAGVSPEGSLHLEYRAADATANPWLALGMLVRAGLAGLAGAEPARVHPESVSGDVPAGERSLPSDLPTALAALEADAVATSWFSNELLRTFLSVKRAELLELEGLDDAAVCRRLADVY